MKYDYYIFLDYSEDYIGYNILEAAKLCELLPLISKLKHYKKIKYKKEYLKSVKSIFYKTRIESFFLKTKIKKKRYNLELFSDISEFIFNNKNGMIFLSIDDNQFASFKRIAKRFHLENITLLHESKLKKYSSEYKVSLVIDNLLNLVRTRSKSK